MMDRPLARSSFFFVSLAIPILTILILSIAALCLLGCAFSRQAQTVSDGEIVSTGGFDLHGTIDCEPNEGPEGTPVTVTIAFDRGASLVYEIHTLQAWEKSSWEFVRTPDIDPVQYDTAAWSVGHGVYLSGKNGVVRFSVRNTEAEIGRGDIDINGGKPAW